LENSTNIVNWKNVFAQSDTFKKNKPFKFAFVEDFFVKDFYEKLYETYPKIDDTWTYSTNPIKTQLNRWWGEFTDGKFIEPVEDPSYSPEWNKFVLYAQSNEFIENVRKFSGVDFNKLKYFGFTSYKKGGFQQPHTHNVGSNTLIMMFYFSKNWQEDDPGGTYMTIDDDESKIIFEPYNLDNSMACFQDGPDSSHGVRLIKKDVERRGIQLYYEKYSDENGWSGIDPNHPEVKSQKLDVDF